MVRKRTINQIIKSNFKEVYLLFPAKISIYSEDTKAGLLPDDGP